MAKKKSNPGQGTFESLDAAPAMPEGYYSGDQPNPNLRRFVEEHATPYDPETDDYNVRAFNQPITTTKATAIYNMHSYHQVKKPHDAIRQYIRHYTNVATLCWTRSVDQAERHLRHCWKGEKQSPSIAVLLRHSLRRTTAPQLIRLSLEAAFVSSPCRRLSRRRSTGSTEQGAIGVVEGHDGVHRLQPSLSMPSLS